MGYVEAKFNQWFEKEIHAPMKARENYGSQFVDNHLDSIKILTEAAFIAGYNSSKRTTKMVK